MQPLQVLVIRDDRTGHQNQSLGLAQALSQYIPIEVHQVPPLKAREAAKLLVLQQPPQDWKPFPKPDLVIGTGSGTHLSILVAGKAYGCFTVLLCTSIIPARFFDLNVVPEHDNQKPRANIVFTKGVLNKVKPSTQSSPDYGLMLIGGESKHYRWNSAHLIKQIQSIIEQRPDIQWHITNSRRTPDSFTTLLHQQVSKITFHHWQDTPSNWLPQQLAKAGTIWVTPDSVSMVYESLTSGNQVYLFELPSLRTRVGKGIEALKGQEAGYWDNGRIVLPGKNTPLWEADRIAKILLNKLNIQPRPE